MGLTQPYLSTGRIANLSQSEYFSNFCRYCSTILVQLTGWLQAVAEVVDDNTHQNTDVDDNAHQNTEKYRKVNYV